MTNIAAERRLLADQGLDIVTRERWAAAQDYTSDRRVDTPAKGFFLHVAVVTVPARTTEAEARVMRVIESIGQQRFGIGCSYNAAACQSGRLYEMQPLSRRGAHTVNDKGVAQYGPKGASLNYAYRALVLPQNVGDAVTDAQVDSAARWAAAQVRAGLAAPGARWDVHRTVAWKDCPGDAGAARLADLNHLTTYYAANGLGEDEMISDAQMTELKHHISDVVTDNVNRVLAHLVPAGLDADSNDDVWSLIKKVDGHGGRLERNDAGDLDWEFVDWSRETVTGVRELLTRTAPPAEPPAEG